MSERFVCLSHTMGVITLFDRSTSVLCRFKQFPSELFSHALFRSLACGLDNPPHG